MKRFRDRRFRGLAKAVTVAYLSTAIAFGASFCVFSVERGCLENKFDDGKMSHQMYIQKCREIGEKEEKVFKSIAIVFGSTFALDVISDVVERE